MIALSADVGGTFTDVVLVDSAAGLSLCDKVLTTPGSTEAIIHGMNRICARAGVAPADIDVLIHGFTIATNAWLTRSGARVVLVVTRGFRDVLEIATQRRADPYDLHLKALKPLAERACVVEIDERVDAFGTVVEPLTEAAIDDLVARVAALDPEAVAVSLLFSYLNPAHEAQIAAALRARLQQVPIYSSSEINPQIDEYPRTNTTVTAAYVGPAVGRYASLLETTLPGAGLTAPILLMRSDGGVSTVASTRINPATMLLSGPAGGVIAALNLSRAIGAPDLVTFDMGGTSADFSLIAGSRTRMTSEREIAGEVLRTPSLDIETISAGGGSIGFVDPGGALRVGPMSAGAVPGPACYGRGGTRPTLTDAALVLGLLDPREYAAGDMVLDVEAARRAVGAEVARPMGLGTEDAAYAMVAIANAQMAQAIRGLSVERGHDMRDFALLSFGGAGSIFAPFLAGDLGMKEMLVPLQPGVFSASGLTLTDMRYAYQATYAHPLADISGAGLAERFRRIVAEADEVFARDRVAPENRRYLCFADMRYSGQVHELKVDLPDEVLAGVYDPAAIAARFYAEHERAYGFADDTMEVEMVNLRIEAVGEMPKATVPASVPAAPDPARIVGERRVYLGPDHGHVVARVFNRADLASGEEIAGPLVVNQPDTTTFVLPGQRLTVDPSGVLRIRSIHAEA